MRAVGITEWGPPEVLHMVELPEPEAGPGELSIRVHAAAVNPTDTVLRSGGRAERLKDVRSPHVPGMDAAGVLEQIGKGVETDLAVGDRVMAIVLPLGTHGAYAERVVVPAESVVRSSAGTTDVEASTLLMNGLTARAALDELALAPGSTLAVTGAPGAVGGYATQLAKADGLHVVADAGPTDERLVRTLGADVVLPRGDDFAARVRDAFPEGVDGLIDAALLNELAMSAVRDGGGMATLRGFDGRGPGDRGVRFHPIYVRNYARDRSLLGRLQTLAEAGALTLRVARAMPAEHAAEAHRVLEGGGTRGRLVLEL